MAVSHASIQSLYTSTGSDKKLIVVWKSSIQTRHVIRAEFRLLSLKSEIDNIKQVTFLVEHSSNNSKLNYILTSHDLSWLQKGQVNWESRGSIALRFGGGFLLDLRRPIVLKQSTWTISLNALLTQWSAWRNKQIKYFVSSIFKCKARSDTGDEDEPTEMHLRESFFYNIRTHYCIMKMELHHYISNQNKNRMTVLSGLFIGSNNTT